MSYSTAFSQAIVTLVFVGDKTQQKLFEHVPTSLICESLNLKAPTLVKILSQLSKAGIIETKEGKSGGVRLKQKAEKISLLDIFEAIEANRPLFQTHTQLNVQGRKPDRMKNHLLETFINTEKHMKKDLEKQTVASFISKLYMD